MSHLQSSVRAGFYEAGALRTRVALALLILVTMPGSTRAARPVRVTNLDGQTIEGSWTGVSKDGQFVLSIQGQPTSLAPSDLMSLQFTGAESRPAATSRPGDEVTAYLGDGSQFDARITATTSETVELSTAIVPKLTLPLARLAAIRFARDESSPAAKPFADALAHRDATQDTLLLVQDNKASSLKGLLDSLDTSSGKFKWRERTIPIDRSRTFGLVLAAGAGTPPAPQARCTLIDGSTWAGKVAGGTADTLKLELTAGPVLDLKLDRIAELRFRNDRMVFLSDIEPASYEFKPWGMTIWPYRKDRSVTGRPIRIGSQQFDRGLGMHSQAVLTYKLTEPFAKFAAVVGIDEAMGSRGNVVFRVLTNGKEAFNSGNLTGKDTPRPVLVAINGTKTLQLCVDFGGDMDIADHADWGAARLIK